MMELDPTKDSIDPVTSEVTRDKIIRGVLEGDPTDYVKMKADLAHLTGVSGMIGQAQTELAWRHDKAQRNTTHVKALLFNRTIIEIKDGKRSGKLSDEGIWTQVRMQDEYQEAVAAEDVAKRNYWKFANLHRDLEKLENAIKKILDHGRDQ